MILDSRQNHQDQKRTTHETRRCPARSETARHGPCILIYICAVVYAAYYVDGRQYEHIVQQALSGENSRGIKQATYNFHILHMYHNIICDHVTNRQVIVICSIVMPSIIAVEHQHPVAQRGSQIHAYLVNGGRPY